MFDIIGLVVALSIFQRHFADQLLRDLKKANTEAAKKERFIQYLTHSFSADTNAQKLISSMTLGAERTIANIPRGAKLARGRADTQTDTLIIEWEKDLTKTGDHAREQLEEYLTGNWKSGNDYRFVLISTDGIQWRRYAPDWSQTKTGELKLGQNFVLREVRRFQLQDSTLEDFPFFLDEILFASERRTATLENIQADFGDTSITFINSVNVLSKCLPGLHSQSELKVAYEQWGRFLSIAYGRFDNSPMMFLVHTYLSVFAKFIAYAALDKGTTFDDSTVKRILNGAIFNDLNIERFVEDDFFHWVDDVAYFSMLKPMFREIIRQLDQYDFNEIKEDILKGVYQELIDLDTRHALGEYYTPDWLCERVIAELPIDGTSKVLDPACGSGSFLRAAIAHIRTKFPEVSPSQIAENVAGIDIHPLSVLIAKTTVLLALGPSVQKARRPIVLNIYLANSLLVPRGSADLFGSKFRVAVDNGSYLLDVKGLGSSDVFDRLISACDNLVRKYKDVLDRQDFTRLIGGIIPKSATSEFPEQLFGVYRAMKIASDAGRDSIWKFILQNSYKPVFLMQGFDFIVGNPPWLTYASVSNADYQTMLRELSDNYRVTPVNKANFPHLEIAAIFLAHSVNYFLRRSGRIAFVLPRSFMSADQHENTRAGVMSGFKLSGVWDLDQIEPLFRVPCCVLFGHHADNSEGLNEIGLSGVGGQIVSGRLPRSQMHWKQAQSSLTWKDTRWYYSRLQGAKGRSRSALTTTQGAMALGSNAYERRFTQGATIVPRNFFFIDIAQKIEKDEDLNDRILSLVTSAAAEAEAKIPWKGNIIRERAETSLLFRTAISKNVVPFLLVKPPLVLLPVIQQGIGKGAFFDVLTSEGLLERDYEFASKWFDEAEKLWNAKRTERNRDAGISLSQYLNWQNKLSGQNPEARFLVIYTSSATDASAVVVDRRKSDHPFIVDHKTYWCETRSLKEAHYVCAYVNSGFANLLIKDFQSKGLFGPRDIHKTIVKIPFPKFNKDDSEHVMLAELGERCAVKAESFLLGRTDQDFNARQLGRIRTQIRDLLDHEIGKIDVLVEKLSGTRSEAAIGAKKRRKRRNSSGQLFDS